MKRGKYIVIEGGEGCGKTYQSDLLFQELSKRGVNCFLGREPGGIKSAEEMRQILKHNPEDISPIGELFGYEFARAEFFDKIVIPKLNEGTTIISDRSGYSTLAYQGYAGKVNLNWIKQMNRIATRGIKPDLAFIIDINPEIGLSKEVVKDRFSAKGLEYHQKVRQGYLEVARSNPEICNVIEYIPNGAWEMHLDIRNYVNKLFNF